MVLFQGLCLRALLLLWDTTAVRIPDVDDVAALQFAMEGCDLWERAYTRRPRNIIVEKQLKKMYNDKFKTYISGLYHPTKKTGQLGRY